MVRRRGAAGVAAVQPRTAATGALSYSGMAMPSPLTPLRSEGAGKRKKETDARTAMRRMLLPFALVTVLGFALGSTPLVMVGAIVWAGWFIYYVLLTRVLDPRGEDTPYVNQHSDIQAMVMRGQKERAAQAYRAVIAADPADVLACEQLVQLASRELKDYELAVWACREAERRHALPGKKLTFGMMAAELYRDQLGDPRRAVVELSRLLSTYPDAPNAAALKEELELIKSHLFEAT